MPANDEDDWQAVQRNGYSLDTGLVTLANIGATTMSTPRPPMTLGNMRQNGVRRLIAYCLNDTCRHQAIIDVSKYPGDTPVPWFQSRAKCGKRGARGRRIDVRPNWKEKPGMSQDWIGRPAGE